MNATKKNSRKQMVTCPRCDGSGRIEAFSGYANGKCFLCWGAGQLEVNKPSAKQELVRKVNLLICAADRAMSFAHEGHDNHAESCLRKMLPDMFCVGTENAKRVLNYMRAGEYMEECGARTHIGTELGRKLASRLIELGREKMAA